MGGTLEFRGLRTLFLPVVEPLGYIGPYGDNRLERGIEAFGLCHL